MLAEEMSPAHSAIALPPIAGQEPSVSSVLGLIAAKKLELAHANQASVYSSQPPSPQHSAAVARAVVQRGSEAYFPHQSPSSGLSTLPRSHSLPFAQPQAMRRRPPNDGLSLGRIEEVPARRSPEGVEVSRPRRKLPQIRHRFSTIAPESTTIKRANGQEALSDSRLRPKTEFSEEEKFLQALAEIPRLNRERNEGNLLPLIEELEAFNPFFQRVGRLVAVCLLKIGRFVIRSESGVLYRAGESLPYFYVILAGRARLKMGHKGCRLKKVCFTGETLLEESVVAASPRSLALDGCKVFAGVCLLQIPLGGYGKLRSELVHFGFKAALHEMEALFKRNYIVKNWSRNRCKDTLD